MRLFELTHNLRKPSMKGFMSSHLMPLIGEKIEYTKPFDFDPNNRFHLASKRVAPSEFYHGSNEASAPLGHYLMRPIYAGSNRINGSVYVGISPQEAIVVDEKYDFLKALYASMKARFVRMQSRFEKELVIDVFRACHSILAWNPQRVSELVERFAPRPDDKITLDLFVRERVGVARHRALLAVYLLERFNRDGFLKQRARMCSTYLDHFGNDEQIEYTLSNGDVVAYDPRVQQVELCVQHCPGSRYESKIQ